MSKLAVARQVVMVALSPAQSLRRCQHPALERLGLKLLSKVVSVFVLVALVQAASARFVIVWIVFVWAVFVEIVVAEQPDGL